MFTDVFVEVEEEAETVTLKPNNDKENPGKGCDASAYLLVFDEKAKIRKTTTSMSEPLPVYCDMNFF